MAVVPTSEPVSVNHRLLVELSILQFALIVVFLSDLSKLSILQPALLVLLNVSLPIKILLLLFNKQIFYTLFDVLEHICDYPKSEKCVRLYIDIIKQASNIFDLGSAFTVGLIKAVKKNKS